VQIEGTYVEGRFVARDNRFRVTVELDERRIWAHLPNSGRLGELLVPGRRVWVVERSSPGRKTSYDLNLVEMDNHWVSVDSRLPNDLVEEALRAQRVIPLANYSTFRREVTFGRSRFDFMLEALHRPRCYVEVKSITLVIGGLACFPDAVTARGKRHVEELAQAVEAGYRGAVLFVVQRADAVGMRPHDESDPAFGQALRDAAKRGVEVYAFGCQVQPGQVKIYCSLPVYLDLP
jgi:sugar fermentation stimulation protein A